jgi:hypothetical protein
MLGEGAMDRLAEAQKVQSTDEVSVGYLWLSSSANGRYQAARTVISCHGKLWTRLAGLSGTRIQCLTMPERRIDHDSRDEIHTR